MRTKGKLFGHRRLVRFGQRQPRDRDLPAPNLFEEFNPGLRGHHGIERRKMGRLQARRAGSFDARPKHAFHIRRQSLSVRGGQVTPEQLRNTAEHQLNHLLGVLDRQRVKGQIHQRSRRHASTEHLLPERDPYGAANERVAQFGEAIEQVSTARLVEHDLAVGQTSARGQDKVRTNRLGTVDGRSFPVEFDRKGLERTSGTDQDFDLLGPQQVTPRGGVRLHESQDRDASLIVGRQFGLDHGAPGLFDPRPAPGCQIDGCPRIEALDQVEPGGVGKLKIVEVRPNTFPERVLTQHSLQLPHHDGRFLVNDRPIETARLVQIVQFLPDRVRSPSPVHAISHRIVLGQE